MVQRKNEQLLSKNILMHPLMQGRDSQNTHITATKIRANVKVSSLAMSCLHKISCSVQAAPAS